MSESPAVAHLCVARFCCVVIAPWACGVFSLPQILTPKVRTQGTSPSFFGSCCAYFCKIMRLLYAWLMLHPRRSTSEGISSLFSLSLSSSSLLSSHHSKLHFDQAQLVHPTTTATTTITTTTNGKSFSTASQSLHSSEHGRHPLHFANACHRRSTRCSCAQRDGVATGQTLR